VSIAVFFAIGWVVMYTLQFDEYRCVLSGMKNAVMYSMYSTVVYSVNRMSNFTYSNRMRSDV
jgi:hypothetical protein